MNAYTQENTVKQFGSFMAGLLIGGLSGAGAVLLLTPQSGEKMRTQIQKKGNDLRKQTIKVTEDALEQINSEAHQIKDDVHDQAEALGQRGQDVIAEQRDNLGQTLKDLGKAVHT
ncbi:MAG: YtxH domain-containing protein [Anaerolineae bacterium]|nr:YtxH domain-containing protein [Anaerolineae bacterium]